MESNDNLFWMIVLFIVILMMWVVVKELFLTDNHSHNPIVKSNTVKEEMKKDIDKKENLEIKTIKKVDNTETNKKTFLENQDFLQRNNKNNPKYVIVLFETGLLYEKLYKSYFKAACYIYLATLLEPKNKEFEKEYIRLCKIVREKNGIDWEYYITLINDISDIDKYMDELLNKGKVKKEPPKPKTVVIKPTPKPIYRKPVQQNTSKFEEFNTESYLHSLGYKVGVTGLNEYQRRRLLKKVLDEGKISKYDVIETLERNVSMFGHRSDRQKAVSDWRNDLRYIKENF